MEIKHDNMTIILGPPGTGKTTKLLSIIDSYIKKGINPNNIGFFTFTRKAANEAKDRAAAKFNISQKDLQYFRTLHSMCYGMLNINKNEMVTREHMQIIADSLGLEMSSTAQDPVDDELFGMKEGDRYFFIENLARVTKRNLKDVWEGQADEELDWLQLNRLHHAYTDYKDGNLLLDYTDMLVRYIKEGYVPKFDVVLIDEAQDLSLLQWEVVQKIIKHVPDVYVAGDDDQAIYKWAGADVDTFLNLEGQTVVLDKSYRIPSTVHTIATDISSRIQNRKEKVFTPRDFKGSVQHIFSLEDVDMDQGNWLLLARNGYLLKRFQDHCMNMGYSFKSPYYSPLNFKVLKAIRYWERIRAGKPLRKSELDVLCDKMKGMKELSSFKDNDLLEANFIIQQYPNIDFTQIWHKAIYMRAELREYYIAALRRGESLTGEPRITINTIHSVKGGECDNVVLLTDISPRTYEEAIKDYDNECRVFYVGVTRAIQNLFIIEPYQDFNFEI